MTQHRRPAPQKAKHFKKTLINLLKYLRPYYAKTLFVLIITLIGTFLTIIGPRISGQATTLLFAGVMAKGQGGGIDFAAIGKILGIILIIYLIGALINYLSNWILSKVSIDIAYNLRKDIVNKINRLPLKYFDGQNRGEVLSRVTNDVENISQNLNSSIQQILSSIVTIVGVVGMMLAISWKLTLIALIVVPLSGLLASFIVNHSQKYFYRQQTYLGHLNGHIEEIYSGHLIVKTFNYEEKATEDFEKLNEELFRSAHKSQFLSAVMHPLTVFLGNIGYVAVCLIGGFEVIAGRVLIGDIQAFIQYVRQLNNPVSQIAQIMNILQSIAASGERVFEILEEAEESADLPYALDTDQVKGDVAFEHVRFGYDADQIVIHDFSLDVKAGQQIAIVGPTGAGKTTLVKLLMRFYELNSGKIMVDGHDITTLNRHELRSLFGMVLQDAWLFSGSIKDNIRYGKTKADDEAVIKACKLARVDHFIRSLDHGYDTIISDDDKISQGQKQLLTIARAFLKDPKILILDEATSSVDTRTEQLIQKGMEDLMKGRTAFVIAHRLSTIKNADQIIVINHGDIVEFGKHDELLERNGFYAQLYNAQFDYE